MSYHLRIPAFLAHVERHCGLKIDKDNPFNKDGYTYSYPCEIVKSKWPPSIGNLHRNLLPLKVVIDFRNERMAARFHLAGTTLQTREPKLNIEKLL